MSSWTIIVISNLQGRWRRDPEERRSPGRERPVVARSCRSRWGPEPVHEEPPWLVGEPAQPRATDGGSQAAGERRDPTGGGPQRKVPGAGG
jgi:hypothetical protein